MGHPDLQDANIVGERDLGRYSPSLAAVSAQRIKTTVVLMSMIHQGMGAKPVVSLPRAQNGIDIAYCSNG